MIQYGIPLEKYVSYDTAFLYCLTLDYNGHKDWRLPTDLEQQDYSDANTFWYQDDTLMDDDDEHWDAIPVRDV